MVSCELVNLPLIWRHVHLTGDRYTVYIEQSKTDPFHCGHTITIHATDTSTCSVRAFRLYAEATTPLQDNSPVFNGGRFSPLSRQHVTATIRQLLQNTQYSYQHYASHGFRHGAATTAAATGIPDWLIKILGIWKSNAFQVYIHSAPAMLPSVLALLARADTPDTITAIAPAVCSVCSVIF